MKSDNEEAFDVFFDDLTAECQRKLLSFLSIKSPDELNLDTFPIFQIPKGDSNEEA